MVLQLPPFSLMTAILRVMARPPHGQADAPFFRPRLVFHNGRIVNRDLWDRPAGGRGQATSATGVSLHCAAPSRRIAPGLGATRG